MKLTKEQLKQIIKEELNEVTAEEEVNWLQLLGTELMKQSKKPLSKELENRAMQAADLLGLYDKIKDLEEPEYRSEVDKGWSTERLTSADVPDSRGSGAKRAQGGSAKKSHVSKRQRRSVPKQNTRLAGLTELKLTKQQLKQIIKEELNEMRGTPSDRLILNEVNLGSVLTGISREGDKRRHAIELTIKYMKKLSQISALDRQAIEFSNQLENAMKSLQAPQQRGEEPESTQGASENELRDRMRKAHANRENNPEEYEAARQAYWKSKGGIPSRGTE